MKVVVSKQEENQELTEKYKIQSRWNEKLDDWDQALSFYNENLQKGPNKVEWSLGEMR